MYNSSDGEKSYGEKPVQKRGIEGSDCITLPSYIPMASCLFQIEATSLQWYRRPFMIQLFTSLTSATSHFSDALAPLLFHGHQPHSCCSTTISLHIASLPSSNCKINSLSLFGLCPDVTFLGIDAFPDHLVLSSHHPPYPFLSLPTL